MFNVFFLFILLIILFEIAALCVVKCPISLRFIIVIKIIISK